MKNFGFIRLYKENLSSFHKLFYRIAGVSADHKLRFMYMKKLTKKYFDAGLDGDILDAGCGAGDYSFFLADIFPNCKVFGIDLSEKLINENKDVLQKIDMRNLTFGQMDISKIDDINKYSFICCNDVLEHIPDQKQAISNLSAALKKEAVFFAHIPLAKQKPVIFDKYLKGFHEWAEEEHIADDHSKESILKLFKECGLKVIATENTYNHYFGEFAVSIIMLFYKPTIINKAILACLTPVTWILTRLDLALNLKSGNAIAILATKDTPQEA